MLAVRTLPTVTAVPVDGITLYPVIAEPFEAGAVQVTVAEALPGTAETPVGASGIVHGVTAAEGEEGKEFPREFVATTVKVTAVPLVNPPIAVFKTLPTVTGLPTEGVIVYAVIVAPPFEAGAVQDTVTDVLLGRAETPVGASGTVDGVTEAEAEENEELPVEFIATTLNVSAVPLVRLLSVAVRTFPTVTELPVDGIIVYPVIAEPPFEAGAVQLTVAEALAATAETPVGAPGRSALGVIAADSTDEVEVPSILIAFMLKVMAVPFVKPVTVELKTFPTVTAEPTEGVIVYPVIGESIYEVGAVQETVAEAFPGVADIPVGIPGIFLR